MGTSCSRRRQILQLPRKLGKDEDEEWELVDWRRVKLPAPATALVAEFTATNEWQRISVQTVSNSTNARNFGVVLRGDDAQTSDISFWGAMLEQQSLIFGVITGLRANG